MTESSRALLLVAVALGRGLLAVLGITLLAVPIQALTARWYLRRSIPLYAKERVVGGSAAAVAGHRRWRRHGPAFRLAEEHAGRVHALSEDEVSLALRVVRRCISSTCSPRSIRCCSSGRVVERGTHDELITAGDRTLSCGPPGRTTGDRVHEASTADTPERVTSKGLDTPYRAAPCAHYYDFSPMS